MAFLKKGKLVQKVIEEFWKTRKLENIFPPDKFTRHIVGWQVAGYGVAADDY